MEISKELIESNWPLTEVVIEAMPKQGKGGIVGIVVAKEGKFTYKIAGSWKTAKNLDRDLSAYEFLNEKQFPYISELLNTKDNKRFIQIDGKLIYLIKFIEGNHPKSDVSTYAELGKITATLHNIKDFPFESDYRPAFAIPDAIKNADKFSFKDEYIEVLKSIRSFDGLTMVPIHTEITPGNVIQKSDGTIMVIDWDEVGIGPAVLDLGVGLVCHLITNDFKIREDEAKAYFKAYFDLRQMSKEERGYIFDAGIYWATLWVQWFDDHEARWNVIKWAIKNKDKIEALYA